MPRGRPPRIPRAQQERELLEAARAVFDERGAQEAEIEHIARKAGISKGLVYRHFGSKDELLVSAVLIYLEELGALLEELPPMEDPVDELLALTSAYLRYGIEHPAFLDCCLSLMRRPAAELLERLPPGVAVRLGQGMARPLAVFSKSLGRARRSGDARVDDPDLWVNYWYTRALGGLHLSRSGVILCTGDFPLPRVRVLTNDELVRIALEDLVADLGVPDGRDRVEGWLAGSKT